MKAREIEELLEPGERLLWEGRPSGWPRPRARRALGGLLLGAVVALLAVVLTASVLAKKPTCDVSLRGSFVRFRRPVEPPPWYHEGDRVFMSIHSSYLRLPVAIFIGLALAAWVAVELAAFARFRARRYGITDRRVVALLGGRVVEARRGLDHEARLDGRTLVFGAVRFEGVADVEAARSALL